MGERCESCIGRTPIAFLNTPAPPVSTGKSLSLTDSQAISKNFKVAMLDKTAIL